MYKIGMTAFRAYWTGLIKPKVIHRVVHANLHSISPSGYVYSAMVF